MTPGQTVEWLRANACPELLGFNQWIGYTLETRDGKQTKVPRNPHSGGLARVNDPATWAAFDDAVAAIDRFGFDGIGFVLTPGDPFVCIDFDKCIDASGALSLTASECVRLLGSYVEYSVSGTGLHVWARGALPQGRRRARGIEVYDQGRFLVMTFRSYGPRRPITDASPEALDWLMHRLGASPDPDALAAKRAARAAATPLPETESAADGDWQDDGSLNGGGARHRNGADLDDDALIEKALNASNGQLFHALFVRGDLSAYGGDASAADLALCNLLAFWTNGSAAQMDRIFRRGALMREKWNIVHSAEGLTYGQMTIQRAIAGTANGYDPLHGSNGARITGAISNDTLAEIVTNARPLRAVTADALEALVTTNKPPAVFVRSARLVRLDRDEHGLPLIEPLSEPALRGRLARCAEFVRVTAKGNIVPVAPPLDVVRDILALGSWPMLPALAGIIEAPTLRPDGTPVTTPGYDPAIQLYYIPAPGLTLPPIPDSPTDADTDGAINFLLEIFCDFPFTDDASRANCLAAMLTPIVRPLIPGPVPMALIDAPQAGTGKSLVAEVITTLATGRSAAMLAAPEDDEAWRKAVTSLLLAGRMVVTVDNVEGKLYAPSLAAALTSTTYQDRILGRSEMVTLPHRVTWLVTGNNIRLGGDLPRRCYWIRIDAKDARPWRRTGFRHPRLLEWVGEQRGQILAAILTLARAWVLAGCPAPTAAPVLGSFEGWAGVVGGILHHAGIPDFLGNLEELYEQADDDTPQWERFLAAWYELWGPSERTAVEVTRALGEAKALRDSLPDDLADALADGRGFNRRLGNALAKRADVQYPCGLSIHRGGAARTGVLRWRVTSRDARGVAGSRGVTFIRKSDENAESSIDTGGNRPSKTLQPRAGETVPPDF